jgi:iron(III) transport system substrate-binding protein
MRQVAEGKLAWAFTDTDDYHVALTKQHPVGVVFPDQGDGAIGTMLIPNSVAIIKGGPHPDAARKLVDWILRAETEALLATAKSAQIPLRSTVEGPPERSIKRMGEFKAMVWDPKVVAENLERMVAEFDKRF